MVSWFGSEQGREQRREQGKKNSLLPCPIFLVDNFSVELERSNGPDRAKKRTEEQGE